MIHRQNLDRMGLKRQVFRLQLLGKFLSLVVVTCLVLATSSAMARESDLQQPIDVSADRSEYDDKAGTQKLIGNVEIRQGTMRITADIIEITLKDNALSRIDGKGSPILYQQENESGELLQGEAREVNYDAIDGSLVLSGGAKLSQPQRNIKSERIEFNVRTQTVSAEGSKDTGRVTIRIEPPKR